MAQAEQQTPSPGSNGGPPRQGQDHPAEPHQFPATDPIGPILVELLHGWGTLSSEDMKRLSIYRSEKVRAAIQALELPKDLKNDVDAQGRMGQLTYYASQLENDSVKMEEVEPTTAVGPAGLAGLASMSAAATPAARPPAISGAGLAAPVATAALVVAAEEERSSPTDEARIASTSSLYDPLDDTLETAARPLTPGGFVKTADDLMALPAEERAEMVAFLQPAELAGVLKRTERSRTQASSHRYPREREHPGLAGHTPRVSGGSRPGDTDVRPTGGGQDSRALTRTLGADARHGWSPAVTARGLPRTREQGPSISRVTEHLF